MNKALLIILSIFLPPLAVFLKVGVGGTFFLNILLCFVFFIPAIIHALYITTR